MNQCKIPNSKVSTKLGSYIIKHFYKDTTKRKCTCTNPKFRKVHLGSYMVGQSKKKWKHCQLYLKKMEANGRWCLTKRTGVKTI